MIPLQALRNLSLCGKPRIATIAARSRGVDTVPVARIVDLRDTATVDKYLKNHISWRSDGHHGTGVQRERQLAPALRDSGRDTLMSASK
jgi:hypothetical protein